MNAILPGQPTETERTTRHLRLCAELAELAMQLARAAAARTLANWAEPKQPQSAEPPAPLAVEPPSPLEAPPPAKQAAKASRAASPTGGTAPSKPTDPAILFTRFAAVARDCIALEARLAGAATAAPPPQDHTLQLRADPRRPLLREAFTRTLKNHPDRAALQRETNARIDQELAADPDQTGGPGYFYFTICAELGIDVDLATVPDALLNTYKAKPTRDGGAPYAPRATSPP